MQNVSDGYDHVAQWRTVPDAWLEDAAPRLTHEDLDAVLRHKIVPYCWIPGQTVYGVVDDQAALEARQRHLHVVGRVKVESYRAFVSQFFAPRLLSHAVLSLALQKPWASARRRLTAPQVGAGLFFLTTLCLSFMIVPAALLFHTIMLVASAGFLLIMGLRLICLLTARPQRTKTVRLLRNDWLPVYTVLVPVFRETAVLTQLVDALLSLDYPQHKLDIKIILEECDMPMRRAVDALKLPSHFDVIIVPRGKPQTKPRALNYALLSARGSLVTIFDAEDMPDPTQLRLAATQFAQADDDVACLQAALDFHNHNQNWLTQQFAAEYAGLFHVILPALAKIGLPMPLGGTSNHFRMSCITEVGGWDPFNVTEDADLGIRFARLGYRTGVINSATLEEANCELGNWMKQRRRWLKGFLQTWLVHNRNPILLFRETGARGFWAIQAMTLGVISSALLHPIFLVVTLYECWVAGISAFSAGCLTMLIIGYAIASATNTIGLRTLNVKTSFVMHVTLPAYWLLLSAAGWMAVFDFIHAPFHWHKTKHGLATARRP
jgi:glycosyltransferase XagB